MTCQTITVKPDEEGGAKVTVTASNEADVTLSFADISNPQWQLMRTDSDGVSEIVNSRSFVNSNLQALEWALYLDDLAVFGESDDGWRIITFKGTYLSTIGGVEETMGLKGEAEFKICKLLGIEDQV